MLRRVVMAGGGTPPGADPYFAQVASLVHFNDADNSTTPVDQIGHAWANSGTAKVSRTSPIIGLGSGLFSGTGGSRFRTGYRAKFDLAANDFTGEVRVRFNALPGPGEAASLFVKWGANSPLLDYWLYLYNSGGTHYLYFSYTNNGSTGGNPRVAWTPTTGVDYLVAVERHGNNLRFYVNELQQGATQSITGTVHHSSVDLCIGGFNGGWPYDLNGRLDEFRLTNGTARRQQPGYTLIQPFPDS